MFRGTLISVPEQLISATEQLGCADFLHTMTPIRFHTRALQSDNYKKNMIW